MIRQGRQTLERVSTSLERLDANSQAAMHQPVTRRKLLGGLLLATAGTAYAPGLIRPKVANAATATTISRGGHTAFLGPILAPDGFPQASLQGTFVGARGVYCLVNAGQGVVPVTVLPTTQVLAGGVLANGVLSALSIGDRLFIFTTIVESGERVAVKIEQNPRIYEIQVGSAAAAQIVGTTMANDPTPGLRLRLTVNALTTFAGGQVPPPGSRVRVATINDTRSGEIVAMNLVTMG